jgi:hypothetical protein
MRSVSAVVVCEVVVCGVVLLLASGCSDPSLALALQAQQRANAVQAAVFERQHDGLRVLLFRDLVARLEATGRAVDDNQRAVLNAVWNERDLIEFWARQQERAGALRLVGVDAKLYADQSAVDLLIKAAERKMDQIEVGLAQAGGAAAGENGDG